MPLQDVYKRQDKDSLYENDDDTSVVTMYLTVSKGNSSENTYHTWKEDVYKRQDLHTYVCLAENQMQTKEYEQVLKSLERMDKKWHRNEEYLSLIHI